MGDYMRKKFKAKKRKKFKIVKVIIYVILIILIYQLTYSLIKNLKKVNSNEEFIRALLKDSNHHMVYNDDDNIINSIISKITNVDFSAPVTLLENTLGYSLDIEQTHADKKVMEEIEEEAYTETETDILTEYIADPNPTNIETPRVYIYNTHQLEGYSATNFEEYNITPNVLMASYLLKEKLNKAGVPTVVETSNISDFLALNGWDYGSSYKASRFYAMDAINKYSSLDLVIDLHRDAISKERSTVKINNKNYAKILFVVGLEHDNYEPNLELTNTLNAMIKEKYPTLTRGVITKKGAGVDGIYNQDLSTKSILIECGGNENSIDEVMNTIEILSKIIKEYLGD